MTGAERTLQAIECLRKLEESREKQSDTEKYVLNNIHLKRRCNRCNHVVLTTELKEEYNFQCLYCDEDLYTIETHTVNHYPKHEEINELIKLYEEQQNE